jgi:hypothetical protein
MTTVFYGATAMGCLIAGLFFLRFWRESIDRLFLLFALAFWVMGVGYAVLGAFPAATEWHLYLRSMRLLAFLLILYAIIDRNRR